MARLGFESHIFRQISITGSLETKRPPNFQPSSQPWLLDQWVLLHVMATLRKSINQRKPATLKPGPGKHQFMNRGYKFGWDLITVATPRVNPPG